jgi:hypothetical protein
VHTDELSTRADPTSGSWIYAHLIVGLLSDDLSEDFLEASPWALINAAYIFSLWAV